MRKHRRMRRIRFDTITQPDGSLAAAWGFRGSQDTIVKEYLATVCRIPEDGRFDRADVSHEFSLFMLAPNVGINYRRSIFKQPALRPLLPAAACLQIAAIDDDDAVERAQEFVEAIRSFECHFQVPAATADAFLKKLFNLVDAPPSQDDGCFA